MASGPSTMVKGWDQGMGAVAKRKREPTNPARRRDLDPLAGIRHRGQTGLGSEQPRRRCRVKDGHKGSMVWVVKHLRSYPVGEDKLRRRRVQGRLLAGGAELLRTRARRL